MKPFSAPDRLSVSLLLVATIALFPGFARPASAQNASGDEELKPIPSGPGIQVCEPVAPGGDAALADFGAACGLWLQWSMGFHPQLGQTPRWDLANRAHKELHVPRMRLSLAQGSRLASILGVTHIAVGQITGTEAKCLLTYQLYAVPAQKAVGAPIKLTGTEAQVIAQLPEAARKLLTGLGVQQLHVPASVEATPAEFRAVGHYGWYDDQKPTDAEQQQIDALAKKLPLASLLSYAHHIPPGAKDAQAAALNVVEQAPGNFLTLGVVATFIYRPSEEFAHSVESKVAALGAPNNAVLAYWAATQVRTPTEAVKAYERIVRLAPRSSTAWNFLARRYGDQGEALRLGRIYAGLTAQEAETLQSIYARWQRAATRATALDPDYQDAWRQLATAATFAGDPERADAAFWKAYSLDKSDVRLYGWGLEMYQQKWGGDPRTLAKVARLSTEAVFPPLADLFSLGHELRSAGFPAEAKILFGRALHQARESVRQYPKLSYPHAVLGYYLNDQNQKDEAEAELLNAVALDPNSGLAHDQLGKLYADQKRFDKAIIHYRESFRITNSVDAKTILATTLADAGEYDEAEKLTNEVLKVQPNSYHANATLGWILAHKKEYEAALGLYRIAAGLQPDNSVPHREMSKIYRSQSKFEEAVEEGEMAVRISPRDYYALTALAEAYASKEDNDSSVKMYLRAIEQFPKYAPIRFDLGKLYLKMGKKAEGRAELKRVLELNPPAAMAKFTQALLDSSP